MYENVTFESILDRMLEKVPESMDKREGSIIYDALAPAAVELQLMYIELDVILKEAFGDTASREYLIRRAAERGIEPFPASKAILKATYTPTSIDIPIGSRFSLNELNYVVLEKIGDGQLKIECESLGKNGNGYFGSVIPIEYIEGLETIQITELLIPGEDEEDTEDFRKRYFDSFSMGAFGGNVKDYLDKTNSIAGVGDTKVTRVWNKDIKPADMIPNEKVKNWYNSTVKNLDEKVKNWLDKVYTASKDKKLTTGGTVLLTIIDSNYNSASAELIEKVQTIIDPEINAGDGLGLAPIGHVVTVKSAENVIINVKTKLTFETGYSWSNFENYIKKAIEDYLLTLRKNWANNDFLVVRIRQIENHILNLGVITDIENTTINGKEENLILREFQIPILGVVSE